ncbi:RluA family pseudouridine synthase [Blastochloris tepida]|uniref:RluA family pseudouridine synthase n=1 Tax=Blastochloris tepida TaxID=2233851 RepID=UPI000F831163|nr:RNA pseudouridine synthase [Blastochloris tepida]
MTGEELQARLLYRDGMMLVLDKPAGLPVHAGPKGGQSLEQLFDALRFGLPRAPALAHRLDKDTSGCLVLGRHRKALARLGALFKAGRIAKTYWAVVEGGPEADEGLIDLPLATREPGRGWWMKVDAAGLPSQTRFRVRGRSPSGLTWLELEPLTGRTHQLRVHCAAMGFPILGDAVYGRGAFSAKVDTGFAAENATNERTRAFSAKVDTGFAQETATNQKTFGPPLHLHARTVSVPFKSGEAPISVTAPVPPHMREALAACGAAV